MKASQAEVLLRIAENTYIENDEVLAEMRHKLTSAAQRILEDEAMLAKAWELNQQDKARFAQYMPRQEPRAAVQQRPALAPVKKEARDEKDQKDQWLQAHTSPGRTA
jgi:hypothetical protein